MKLDKIREIAKKHGIKPGKSRKDELIRGIQAAESNEQCFGKGMNDVCRQGTCLWKDICL